MNEQEEYLRATLLRGFTPTEVTMTVVRVGNPQIVLTVEHIPVEAISHARIHSSECGYHVVCNACRTWTGLDPEGYCYQAEGKRCTSSLPT